jgi:NAD(P)H-flavin reductase
VTEVVGGLDVDWSNAGAMMCGPDVMMRVAGDLLVDLGMRADLIQLTLERNMHCGIGRCGHCQLGPTIICRDGPVMRYPEVAEAMAVGER